MLTSEMSWTEGQNSGVQGPSTPTLAPAYMLANCEHVGAVEFSLPGQATLAWRVHHRAVEATAATERLQDHPVPGHSTMQGFPGPVDRGWLG
jgi:hypothetical protein